MIVFGNIEETTMRARSAEFRRVRLFVEQLGSRDLPALMGANALVGSLPVFQEVAAFQTQAAESAVHLTDLQSVSGAVRSVPLGTVGTAVGLFNPATADVLFPNTPSNAVPIPGSGDASDSSAVIAARALSSRNALSSAHVAGVESDLSPLAEAPEGIG
jgi:hypothetical protein